MIAISYRRDDSLPIAGRLYDRLQARFGKNEVFMDFDSIPPGIDFREKIMETIEQSDLVIAIIGPHWLGTKSDGARRIDDPTDFVRLEIDYALKKRIPVIPLLVNNTPMPSASTLPTELQTLAYRNALPLDTGLDFHVHVDRLINGICALPGSHTKRLDLSPGLKSTTDEKARTRRKAIGWLLLSLWVFVAVAIWIQGGKKLPWPIETNSRVSPTPETFLAPSAPPHPSIARTAESDKSPRPIVSATPAVSKKPETAPTVVPAVALTFHPGPPDPWLGIRVQSLNANAAYQKTYTGIYQGVVVQMVEPASRAAESEIWNADLITHLDGVPVSSEYETEEQVSKKKPGDTVTLTIIRKNRPSKIPVLISERSRLFAGIWEGTKRLFSFGDRPGNSAYKQADNSPVRVEITDNEEYLTATNPKMPPMQQSTIPNDWWYHQDSRTLAWANDPQYQIVLLGDGNNAILKQTPYKDQVDLGGALKPFLTTSRALLQKVSDRASGKSSLVVDGKSSGPLKAEAALSSNQTVVGQMVLLRITLGGSAQFTLPELAAIEGLEVQACGIASPEIDPGVAHSPGVVYDYAILPLKAGRFTIPSQSISTPSETLNTTQLELTVRSGRPELPTFKEWLNRDGFGNLLPPRKATNSQKHEAQIQPMTYKRSGKQRLGRFTVKAYFNFSVVVPTDIFPTAGSVFNTSNILMPPESASPSVTYLPPRAASGFDATYERLSAGASPADPTKVIHYKARKENSFIVQSAEADHGAYIAGFRKGPSMYLMDVWYPENDCPFTADTLKAMSDSFLANATR